MVSGSSFQSSINGVYTRTSKTSPTSPKKSVSTNWKPSRVNDSTPPTQKTMTNWKNTKRLNTKPTFSDGANNSVANAKP